MPATPKHLITSLIIVAALAGLSACGQKVTRVETDTVTDLSGNWNDTDSRLVADEMIQDALSRSWLPQFNREKVGQGLASHCRLGQRLIQPAAKLCSSVRLMQQFFQQRVKQGIQPLSFFGLQQLIERTVSQLLVQQPVDCFGKGG